METRQATDQHKRKNPALLQSHRTRSLDKKDVLPSPSPSKYVANQKQSSPCCSTAEALGQTTQ